jgi:hypothetical protein
MPPPDSSAIDAALIDRLYQDPTLKALMPDGVYMDQAPPNAQRFVIVSLIDEADVPKFGGRAYEDHLFLVKAVALSTSGANVKGATHRIDELLEDQPLTVAGYTWMAIHRERRIRYTEVDEIDASIRWYHRGGQYRCQFSI